MTSSETRMNVATSVAIWVPLNADAAVRTRATSVWRSTRRSAGQGRHGLDRHAHDVLVGLDEFVAKLNGELERRLRALQRDHGVVNVAGSLDHVRHCGVCLARCRVDRLEEPVERLREPLDTASGLDA